MEHSKLGPEVAPSDPTLVGTSCRPKSDQSNAVAHPARPKSPGTQSDAGGWLATVRNGMGLAQRAGAIAIAGQVCLIAALAFWLGDRLSWQSWIVIASLAVVLLLPLLAIIRSVGRTIDGQAGTLAEQLQAFAPTLLITYPSCAAALAQATRSARCCRAAVCWPGTSTRA